jgi:hypothetical protein
VGGPTSRGLLRRPGCNWQGVRLSRGLYLTTYETLKFKHVISRFGH